MNIVEIAFIEPRKCVQLLPILTKKNLGSRNEYTAEDEKGKTIKKLIIP